MKKIIIIIISILFITNINNSFWEKLWCTGWPDAICSQNFEIKVSDILPFWDVSWINEKLDGWWKKTAESLVIIITEKLLIWLWSIALIIMTIWWWYMIFYHWQDDMLSKGKKIFISWIVALIVALSSSIIIKFFTYIVYIQ